MCERLAAERGAEPDWSVVFNDRRVRSRELADPSPATDGTPSLRDELTRTTLTWGERNDMPKRRSVPAHLRRAGHAVRELWADSHFVSPADMAGLLRHIERVLVDEALGDGAPVGLAGTQTQ